ncbi:YLR356W [Saccharomyces arboricola H-6]|uniref:YLR356W n=1 Tax=Saccharomyces arboricola (strain H-6 / AS 2.3317 / CBS 10644) TaxID=1160507 RepID=J8Q4U2_SACAR|nr:YLR356W [Saccharomyces arboricola H-6]
MSVCLAITKGIAVSSIGLYSGLLASATLISSTTPLEVLTGSLTPTLSTLKNAATVLGAFASTFFCVSFFGAPPSLRHPYLLYGMLAAPLSSFVLGCASHYKSRKYSKISKDSSLLPEDTKPAVHELSDSIIDLGEDTRVPGSSTPDEKPAVTTPPKPAEALQTGPPVHTKNLVTATAIAILGFVQAVVGIYGEGQFI